MLSMTPELRVTLWSDATPATEQFTTRIRALVPHAQVSAGFGPSQLCVHLGSDEPAAAALADMLRRESAVFVYSYHWYTHELKTPVSQTA